MSVFSFLWSFPIFYATFHTKVLKQKVKERVWFGFISFNLQSRFKNVDVWAYCRKSLVADFLKLVLLLNLVVIERRNYGGFKIFMYSLMMIFFFFFFWANCAGPNYWFERHVRSWQEGDAFTLQSPLVVKWTWICIALI